MNKRLLFRIVGLILCLEALCLLLPLAVALLTHGSDVPAFLWTIGACLLVGVPLTFLRERSPRFQTRDGYACVALCWLVLSAFGALPYLLSGAVPTYVDAFFETVSGFTTTGASILSAPSAIPRGIQFWRALTQWMGGMGILVLVLALLPKLGAGSMNLMRAESPGPISSKLSPKTTQTAKILYLIYGALTAGETLALRIAGMPWFDSLTTAFTTISTGGFSVRDTSIAFYQSETINWIIVAFMFLAGINFSVLFLAVRRKFREALHSEELRVYVAITLVAVALISGNLIAQSGCGAYQAISQSTFQVVTLMTTTGYCTADFALWPAFAQTVLICVMFVGGCAGSTSGGVKVSRIVLLYKSLRREVQRILHPREVRSLRLEYQAVEESTVASIPVFFFAYLAILLICALIVSLDNVSFGTAFSSALTMISNVGPGIEAVGPTQNFAFLSAVSKIALSVTMLFGRLEILPLLVLFFPKLWRQK